ncbi:class I SAM-dependent methyltransferase [Aidingimonas lacisalsi]|uniref:class I SAM-dependent methyltransferase n=1 Tax=Aidingimonas lacisalsi TaxID=2604086 RepID=UPI0011D2133B
MQVTVGVYGDELRPLADALGLPMVPTVGPGLTLAKQGDALVLAGEERRYGKPLRADFVTGRAAHRRRFGGGRGQLVAKACGLGKIDSPTVIDATAGLGRDAFVLAGLGARVMMIERSPVIHALLDDALQRARQVDELAEVVARMWLYHGDACCDLPELTERSGLMPQVVHLDPMFPHRSKSALVKKEMRVFRELAGGDDDAPRLLEAALATATHRVVVKRPRKASPIEGPEPHHVIEGKTSRYDLYVHRSLTP